MTDLKSKRPWSRGEKAVLAAAVVALIAVAIIVIVVDENNSVPVVTVPNPTMPNPNAFDYIVAASQYAVEGWPMPGQPPPPANSAASPAQPRQISERARAAMDDYNRRYVSNPKNYDLHDPKVMAGAIALVQQNQAAVSGLEQGLPYECLAPPVRSWSQTMPYLAHFRSLARVLSLQANVDAITGDWNGSVTSSLDAIRLGSDIPHGGVTIDALVGYACEAIGRKPLWDNLDSLNAGQCRQVATTIEIMDANAATVADVVTEEKWSGIAGLQEVFRMPDWQSHMAQLTGQGPGYAHNSLSMALLGKRRVMRDFIDHMDASIAAARGPYGTKAAVTPSDPVTDVIAMGRDQFAWKTADTQAEDRLLATSCALRAYKLERGAYPPTLAQLVPSYLHSVPLDPFSPASTPLRYRLAGTKYVLYSIGPDMRDDGGTPTFDASAEWPHFVNIDSRGDIVAGVNL